MKIHEIDLHIHTIFSKESCANLSIKDTLEYYQRLGERVGERYIIRINDHDTILGGISACDVFFSHRDRYPNLFVIPGVEFNTNLNYVLKYKDPTAKPNPKYPDSDEKYKFVFKKAHIGAAPILKSMEDYKRWRNNKGLIVYSKLAKMHLDLSQGGQYYFKDQVKNLTLQERNNLTNLGEQLIGYKNMVRKFFGVKIPFEVYEKCVKDGLTFKQIVDEFSITTAEYMQQNYEPFKNKRITQIQDELLILCAREFRKNSSYWQNQPFDKVVSYLRNMPDSLSSSKSRNFNYDPGGLKRLHFDELCEMVEQGGGVIDFEHPNKGFLVHSNAEVPKEYFEGIDWSVLDPDDQYKIATEGQNYVNPHNNTQKALNIIANSDKVDLPSLLGGENCNFDYSGLIRLQILKKACEKNNVKLPHGVLGAEIPRSCLSNVNKLPAIMETMEKSHILCNLGSDKHMNIVDKYMLAAKDKPKIINKDHKVEVIDDNYVQNLYDNVKIPLELDTSSIDRYKLDEDKVYKSRVKNLDTDQFENIENQKDRVVQSSYCDTILGKEVDFTSSSLFTVKRGAVLTSFSEATDTEKYYANNLKRALIDLYDYANIRENKSNQEYMQNVDKLTKEISQQFRELKDENKFTDERAMSSFVGLTIAQNRKKIDELNLNQNNLLD